MHITKGSFGILLAVLTTLLSAKLSTNNDVRKAMKLLIGNDIEASCADCGDGKPEIAVTEDSLRRLRIEFIKAQILKKLKLEEAPSLKLPALPAPISVLPNKPTSPPPDLAEPEFYGFTDQIKLLASTDDECIHSDEPTSCFGFALPSTLNADELSLAELWIYKQRDFMDGDPNGIQTLSYHERFQDKSIEMERHKTNVTDGWIKLIFTKNVKRWLEAKTFVLHLQVQCPSCGYRHQWKPISTAAGMQPVLTLTTEATKKKRQRRSSINCAPGITECCREKLYISFKDVGWDDWIISPKGYDAYFCSGSCSSTASIALTGQGHASILRTYHSRSKRVELVSCCTPTQMSPLHIIIANVGPDGNFTDISSKVLPSMVAESCGCN